jgi:hypothetical protein
MIKEHFKVRNQKMNEHFKARLERKDRGVHSKGRKKRNEKRTS